MGACTLWREEPFPAAAAKGKEDVLRGTSEERGAFGKGDSCRACPARKESVDASGEKILFM